MQLFYYFLMDAEKAARVDTQTLTEAEADAINEVYARRATPRYLAKVKAHVPQPDNADIFPDAQEAYQEHLTGAECQHPEDRIEDREFCLDCAGLVTWNGERWQRID